MGFTSSSESVKISNTTQDNTGQGNLQIQLASRLFIEYSLRMMALHDKGFFLLRQATSFDLFSRNPDPETVFLIERVPACLFLGPC